MSRWFTTFAAVLLLATSSFAQDRLKTYPGYERYSRLSREIQSSVKSGALQVMWTDTTHFEYVRDGKRYRYDARSLSATEIPLPTDQAPRRGGPERGRQFDSAISPDKKLRAYYKDRNLWLSNADSSNAIAITTEGNEQARTKFGIASWVYGEELDQVTAMWWSPDSRQVAYYGFDESKVPDFLLQMNQTKLYSTIDTEAYPKAGDPNPIVELYAYDIASKQRTRIDVRDGKPFTNDVVGHYVYNIEWTPDGSQLTLNRTNRRQNIMEHVACATSTGQCRVLVREEWPTGWVENSPAKEYLSDGKRFIWASERTGFRNLYLYDLNGKLITTLTKHPFEVGQIIRVDENAKVVYYTARSGDNHMKVQLHRVGLDGRNDRRLTDPALHHTVTASPGASQFVIVSQTHDKAPVTRLIDGDGKTLSELATSDIAKFQQLQLRPVEMFTFKAADGTTDLHGMLHKPSDFDPNKKYPVLLSVYGGPATNGASEVFRTPHPYTEFGFLVVTLDSRSAAGRGKRFLDAIYQKLGVVEVDDQAAGIKALCTRSYVDCSRVGIFGTSYGGYVSALAVLRHPDVFHAASAMSPVTDWRQYDTIYTERYMWIPQENTAGYDAGSAMPYVDKLRGRLMLYYGTADNNVHPNNTMQLIQALQRAGKSFEVQIGPDRGHTALNGDRMMEFFIENLVLQAKPVS
jgi:dipeptidyl-peptidase-4